MFFLEKAVLFYNKNFMQYEHFIFYEVINLFGIDRFTKTL